MVEGKEEDCFAGVQCNCKDKGCNSDQHNMNKHKNEKSSRLVSYGSQWLIDYGRTTVIFVLDRGKKNGHQV